MKLSMQSNSNVLFKSSMITLTVMILGMVVIGGITRLTGSGLSIVEWKPIVGMIPPLSTESWMQEFAKYQQSPEFLKINFGMTLTDFQSIFWLEYIHRLWGRLLGIVLLVPTFLVLFKRQHRNLLPMLIILWTLGALQGLMGWLMVKSGLKVDPHVSPYRLAVHLLLGFATFGFALWMTLSVYKNNFKISSHASFPALNRLIYLGIILLLCTAFFGALVAGLKAGLVYNTFPYMGESLIPRELLTLSPWWLDLLENPVSVQFIHRIFAVVTTLVCAGLFLYQRTLNLPNPIHYLCIGIFLAALFQVFLGIVTLLLLVPIGIAVLHQCFAFILFGILITTLFVLQPYHPRVIASP